MHLNVDLRDFFIPRDKDLKQKYLAAKKQCDIRGFLNTNCSHHCEATNVYQAKR